MPKKQPTKRSRSTKRNPASSSSTAKAYPTLATDKYFVKLTMLGPKDPKTAGIICGLVQIFNTCLQQLALPYLVEDAEVCAGFDEDASDR